MCIGLLFEWILGLVSVEWALFSVEMALLSVERALLSVDRALLSVDRSLLSVERALLSSDRALLSVDRALLSVLTYVYIACLISLTTHAQLNSTGPRTRSARATASPSLCIYMYRTLLSVYRALCSVVRAFLSVRTCMYTCVRIITLVTYI